MSAIPRGLGATAQKRSLVVEIKESLGVIDIVAHAAFTRRERADLARPIQPYDHEENKEAPA
jgi:hypothetical protein